jgi:hypothetical protein
VTGDGLDRITLTLQLLYLFKKGIPFSEFLRLISTLTPAQAIKSYGYI